MKAFRTDNLPRICENGDVPISVGVKWDKVRKGLENVSTYFDKYTENPKPRQRRGKRTLGSASTRPGIERVQYPDSIKLSTGDCGQFAVGELRNLPRTFRSILTEEVCKDGFIRIEVPVEPFNFDKAHERFPSVDFESTMFQLHHDNLLKKSLSSLVHQVGRGGPCENPFIPDMKAPTPYKDLPSLPTAQSWGDWLTELIGELPIDMDYYILNAKDPETRASIGLPPTPLQCDNRLMQTAQKLEGIHYPYAYISRTISPFSMHIEDAGLSSINLLHAGSPKVWIVIPPHHSRLLESKLRETFRGIKSCTQFVRHLAPLITPLQLLKWSIDFTIIHQEPGQVVGVLGDTYHFGLNLGPNCAEAINLTPNGDWQAPVGYRFCSEKCTGDTYIDAQDLSILPSNSDREFSPLFEDDTRSEHDQVAVNEHESNTNMEFDDQLLETPNSAKSTDSDAFELAWRTAFELEDCGTPPEVVSSVRVPGMQSTDTDALQGSSELSPLFEEQSCTSSTYESDVESAVDLLMDTPMPNSILDGGSEYPSPRSSSVPPLDSSGELLTLDNDTIMDACTPTSTVVSTDLVNTHYQTPRSEHCVKQASGLLSGDRESMLEAGLGAGLHGSHILGRKRKHTTDEGSSPNTHIVSSISITSDRWMCCLRASAVAAGYEERQTLCILEMWDNRPKDQAAGCVLRTIQLACEIGKPAILECLRDAMRYAESQAPTKDTAKSIDGIVESHLAAENFERNISLNSLYDHRSALHRCFQSFSEEVEAVKNQRAESRGKIGKKATTIVYDTVVPHLEKLYPYNDNKKSKAELNKTIKAELKKTITKGRALHHALSHLDSSLLLLFPGHPSTPLLLDLNLNNPPDPIPYLSHRFERHQSVIRSTVGCRNC